MKQGMLLLLAGLLAGCNVQSESSAIADAATLTNPDMARSIAHGRDLIEFSGCNDCHTENYGLAGGEVPESEWLMGSVLGWKGPWGTTYAPNLRLTFEKFTEDQWVAYARTLRTRPPMPWFALNRLGEAELRDMYRYVRTLEVKGEAAPDYLPPGVEPPKPYFGLELPEAPAPASQ